jgi:molecular chaperone GrpE
MSENKPPSQNHPQPQGQSPLSGTPSPEELEAAQAANEFNALTSAQEEVATLQARNNDLADSYLRWKASPSACCR